MAVEQKGKGTNIMLGPDISIFSFTFTISVVMDYVWYVVDIVRVPLGGRCFEMFGEDPFLTARLVVPSVIGIQSQGIIATAKHYIDNDQE